jgi:hypothetical protein
MKKLQLTLALIIIAVSLFANTITAVSGSDWSTSSTWNLNRSPQNSDTVIVPSGITVLVKNNILLNNITLKIYGGLNFTSGKLAFDNNSTIEVFTGGSIITNNPSDQIKIGTTFKLKGAGNIITGPMVANSSTGSYPTGFATLSTLPVTFTAFTATANGSDITLTWSTSQEFNNNNFEVQRSFDGSNWTVISVVMGAGNANTAANYKVVDHNMTAAAAYYRIRQVDLDGNYSFSAVKTISSQLNTTAKIYAADKNVHVDLGNSAKSNVHITVYNSNGQALLQQTYANATGKISLSNINVNTGIYIVQVTDAKGWMASAKILL